MNSRIISYAGIITMICFAIFTAMTYLWPDVVLQPSFAPLPESEFLKASYQANSVQLAWFALDIILIIGYVTVFLGLYAASDPRYKLFARVGLAMILAAGTFDFIENSYFNSIALGAQNGANLSGAPIILMSAIGYLKTVASIGALAFLGVALPRKTTLERVLVGLMAIAVIGTIVGIVIPDIAMLVNFPRIAVIAVVVAYFWNMKPLR